MANLFNENSNINWIKNEFNLDCNESQINELQQSKSLSKVFSYLQSRVKNKKNYQKHINYARLYKITEQINIVNNRLEEEMNLLNSDTSLTNFSSNMESLKQLVWLFMLFINSEPTNNTNKFDQNNINKCKEIINKFMETIQLISEEKFDVQSLQIDEQIKMDEISRDINYNVEVISKKLRQLKELNDRLETDEEMNLMDSENKTEIFNDNLKNELSNLNFSLIKWKALMEKINKNKLIE